MALTDGGVQATMPVMPTGMSGGGFGGGFGGYDGGWWIILFILVLFGGWGNNGWGGNGGGSLPGYSQVNDFSSLERENDIIREQICDGFANTNQILANGFQGIQTSFANAELSRSNTQAALMGQMYQMSMADLQRGCDTQAAINTGFASTNYNMATQGAAMQTSLATASRDIIDSQRDGTRAVLDALTAQRIEDKNAQIADLTSQLNAARLAASQAAQTNQLIDTLRPAPVPAYQTVNPWSTNGCGCYNGCCGMAG